MQCDSIEFNFDICLSILMLSDGSAIIYDYISICRNEIKQRMVEQQQQRSEAMAANSKNTHLK